MSDSINFDSVAAMLCGQPLNEEQKEDVKKFNEAYDKALIEQRTKKSISVQVNEAMYKKFSLINQTLNVSNNSTINRLIATYVSENEKYLSGS